MNNFDYESIKGLVGDEFGNPELPDPYNKSKIRKKWCKAAGIRAVKTVAQTAIATIGTGAVLSEINWINVVSASALAGILSLLTSIAGLPEVDK